VVNALYPRPSVLSTHALTSGAEFTPGTASHSPSKRRSTFWEVRPARTRVIRYSTPANSNSNTILKPFRAVADELLGLLCAAAVLAVEA